MIIWKTLMASLFIILLALLVILVIFIVIGLFLNKFHKMLYGKGTACAFIPLAQGYLLGKLTFNKTIGWVVVAATIILARTTTTINGVTETHELIPGGSNLVSLAKLGLLIYAIIKYNKINKGEIPVAEAAASSDSFSFQKSEVPAQPTTPQPELQNPMTEPPQEGPSPTACPNCGAPMNPDAIFCTSCGQKVK